MSEKKGSMQMKVKITSDKSVIFKKDGNLKNNIIDLVRFCQEKLQITVDPKQIIKYQEDKIRRNKERWKDKL